MISTTGWPKWTMETVEVSSYLVTYLRNKLVLGYVGTVKTALFM